MRGIAHARRLPLLAALAVAAIAAVLLAGCGSSSDSSSSSGGGGGKTNADVGQGIRASTGNRAAVAARAGATAATQAGGRVTLAPRTIGIINFLNGIESSDRLAATTRLAARDLGWKTIQCDGRGTPSVFVTCGNSLLDQKVDGIIDIAIDPGLIAGVITKARGQGVPVIQVGGGNVPQGGLSGNYGPNEVRSGQVLATALLARLRSVSGTADIAVQDYPASWARVRTDQLTAALRAGSTNVKVKDSTETDASNLVGYTRKTVTDQLTQDPNLKAFWFAFDSTGQVGGQVVASRYAGKTFPDRPLVATFHADLGTLALMRRGDIDMTSDVNYDAGVWEGIDNMAEFFARRRPMMQQNQPTYPVIGDPFTYSIVTRDNLPPAGQYTQPRWDIPTYFATKWRDEFGL